MPACRRRPRRDGSTACPPGKDSSKDWRPRHPPNSAGRGGVFFALHPVGNPWQNRGKFWAFPLPPKPRTQKKVLSLVLCVAMMLSVMVMSTGAVTITDADDISPQYAEAAEVLTGMGIINGYETTPSSRKTPLSAPKLPR